MVLFESTYMYKVLSPLRSKRFFSLSTRCWLANLGAPQSLCTNATRPPHLPMMCSSLSHVTKSSWFRLPQFIPQWVPQLQKLDTCALHTQLVSVIVIAVQVEFQVDLVDTKLWKSRRVTFDHQTGLQGLQYVLTRCTNIHTHYPWILKLLFSNRFLGNVERKCNLNLTNTF